MAATIQMPTVFDESLRSMCSDAVSQAVAVLAAKHGFDAEEALRDVGVAELKLVRKRGPAPKKKAEKPVKNKKEKAPAGEPKPKKPKTGYLLFLAEVRDESVATLTKELAPGAKLLGKEVIRAGAAKWKALSKEDQEVWVKRAKDAATPEVAEGEEEEGEVIESVAGLEELESDEDEE